jgi:uncharacterized protein (DUF885 family)
MIRFSKQTAASAPAAPNRPLRAGPSRKPRRCCIAAGLLAISVASPPGFAGENSAEPAGEHAVALTGERAVALTGERAVADTGEGAVERSAENAADATAAPAAAPARAPHRGGLDAEFGDAFLDAYWRLHTEAAIAAGYYAVGSELVVPDAAARARKLRFLQDARARLAAIPAAQLDGAGRTDRAVLDNQLASEIWALTEKRDWEWDPSLYNVADAFALLLDTPYAPLEQRLRTVLARLEKVPAYYAAALANLRNPTREHTRMAIEQNTGALDVLGPALEEKVRQAALAPGERVLFARRIGAARSAIQAYVDALTAREAQGSATARSFRLGRELYEQQFAFDIASGGTAEALYQRALQEKESLLGKMDVLADELWPKAFPDAPRPANRLEKIGTLIAKLSEQHVSPEEFFATIERTIPAFERWISDHQLLTLDPTRPLQVRITPAYKRGIAAASIDAPGPYDATAATFFNVDPIAERGPQRTESFLREYNRWVLPVLIMHEALPGHYVQLLYANKSPSRIKSLFGNGAMVEGWAVYGERMMMESGYGDDTAEQWLMYDKFNLRSVCNTILDYGVHVLDMSEADAHHLLVDEAFQTEEQAREKWHRVTVTSVQLTSYFAGYSAIYDLRERLKRQYGSGFSLKRFHERFLAYGSAPVTVIEAMLADEGLQDRQP